MSSSVSGTTDAASFAKWELTLSPSEVSAGTGLKAPMERGSVSVCVGMNLLRRRTSVDDVEALALTAECCLILVGKGRHADASELRGARCPPAWATRLLHCWRLMLCSHLPLDVHHLSRVVGANNRTNVKQPRYLALRTWLLRATPCADASRPCSHLECV